VEGTGSYGAGLARYLKAAGIAVMEVERPKRRHLIPIRFISGTMKSCHR
jgi:predicted dinucleotide-binding enzyme